MSRYDVTVPCPRCDAELTINVTVSGSSYRRASRSGPAEHPDVEFSAPVKCEHVPDESTEFAPGWYTPAERTALDKAIEYETMVAAQSESDNDGPDDRGDDV